MKSNPDYCEECKTYDVHAIYMIPQMKVDLALRNIFYFSRLRRLSVLKNRLPETAKLDWSISRNTLTQEKMLSLYGKEKDWTE